MINKKGRILVEFVEKRGWSSFNGNITGNEEREYTFTGGKGCTVIDRLRDGGQESEGRNREDENWRENIFGPSQWKCGLKGKGEERKGIKEKIDDEGGCRMRVWRVAAILQGELEG